MNLLLITLDSVREDYFRGPTLDRLRGEGTYFSQAISCAPSTPESHAAMFSGCYPPVHGLRNHASISNDRTPHLFEILDEAGFDVAACTRLTSMPARTIGGCDDIVAAHEELLRWGDGRRHALFFHVWRTHYPYLIGSTALRSQLPTAIMDALSVPALREQLLAGYARAVHASSELLVAPLEQTLRQVGAWDDTLVVIWSDHGEAFGAGGEPFHGYTLVDETLRVPLLLRGPGVPAGQVIAEQVRTIDMFPTLLELLDVRGDGRFFWRPHGTSFAPWLTRTEARQDRLAYAECCAGGKSIGLGRPFGVASDAGSLRRAAPFRYALRMPAWKLVGDDLFDLEHGEHEPVESVAGMTVAGAKALIRDSALGVDAAATPPPPAGGRALLESLGYVEAAPGPSVAVTADDALADRDGVYPSYDVLWTTAGGQLVAPKLLHYQDKDGHCELGPEHMFILRAAGAGRTVGAIAAELAARLDRGDRELLAVFPQFALADAQLAETLERLRHQGFVTTTERGIALAAGVAFDFYEATLVRAADRLIADVDGLEAVAIEHMLGGATAAAALTHARAHARELLCEEAREVLALAAKRHLLRLRKAEAEQAIAMQSWIDRR